MSFRRLLLPVTPLYRLGLALREWRLQAGLETVRRLQWPVVSVGSLSAGGAGKTPMAIALANGLAARGVAVDVLSRGYGRQSSGAVRVRIDGTAEEFGDEPLLIARATGAPVYVAAQRFRAGQLAEADVRTIPASAAGRVHLLDDGFQHRQLHRDVDILLLSREDWRDRLLPAGNLREGQRAAERASVVAIPSDDAEFEQELRAWGWRGPVWRVRRTMDVPEAAAPAAAFCGIARPEQFFAGLEAAGVKLAARMAFGDHHCFTEGDLREVVASARRAGAATLITTQKDRVRMGAMAELVTRELLLRTADVRVEIEERAVDWLVQQLPGAGGI